MTEQGDKLMTKAFNKKKVTWVTKLFSDHSSNLEESSELFTSASHKYKYIGAYDKAANACINAAKCHVELGGSHNFYQGASSYIDGSKMILKNDPNDTKNAISCLDKAVNLYIDDGRFSNAAKCKIEIGAIYEKHNDVENAINSFLKAIEWIDDTTDHHTLSATKLRIAHLYTGLKKFQDAAKLFEETAFGYMDTPTMRWSTPRYMFKAVLCILANDDFVGAQNAIERYKMICSTFETTSDYKFLSEIMTHYESNSIVDYVDSVVDYDSITKMDQWTIDVLLSIKRTIDREPSLS